MTIRSDMPQEDEFALLSLGTPSVYRGFFDPTRLSELQNCLELDYWITGAPPNWATTWLTFLARVSECSERPLLLKSPNHSFRIAALERLFPTSPWIWITRDPYELYESNRRMWKTMAEEYSFWHWQDTDIDAFVCSALRYVAQSLQWATQNLPRDRLLIVDHAELIKDSAVTQRRILTFLQVKSEKCRITSINAAPSPHQARIYSDHQNLPPDARNAIQTLGRQQQHAWQWQQQSPASA